MYEKHKAKKLIKMFDLIDKTGGINCNDLNNNNVNQNDNENENDNDNENDNENGNDNNN